MLLAALVLFSAGVAIAGTVTQLHIDAVNSLTCPMLKQVMKTSKDCKMCHEAKHFDVWVEAANDPAYLEKLREEKEALRKEKERKLKAEADRIAALKQKQPCKMKESSWIYTGKSCKGGLANGKGTAMNESGELTFEGKIKNGVRVKGLINYMGMPTYDGPIVGGRPDGLGVCFHEGEPEECKYYKGKRIDAIFKQRIEMAKQREEMNKMRKEMSELKASQGSSSNGRGSNAFADGVKQEAGKRIASEIFNNLF